MRGGGENEGFEVGRGLEFEVQVGGKSEDDAGVEFGEEAFGFEGVGEGVTGPRGDGDDFAFWKAMAVGLADNVEGFAAANLEGASSLVIESDGTGRGGDLDGAADDFVVWPCGGGEESEENYDGSRSVGDPFWRADGGGYNFGVEALIELEEFEEGKGGEPHDGGSPEDVGGEVAALDHPGEADDEAEEEAEEEEDVAAPPGGDGDEGEEEEADGGVAAGEGFSFGGGVVMEEAFEFLGAVEFDDLAGAGAAPFAFEKGIGDESGAEEEGEEEVGGEFAVAGEGRVGDAEEEGGDGDEAEGDGGDGGEVVEAAPEDFFSGGPGGGGGVEEGALEGEVEIGEDEGEGEEKEEAEGNVDGISHGIENPETGDSRPELIVWAFGVVSGDNE